MTLVFQLAVFALIAASSIAVFFHAFPRGLEKAAINRISLILPSRKEEREILFPFRRDQEIGSSLKKNAWYK